MKNAEVCRGINSFTLGVQSVNPKARVLVMWTGDWQVKDVEAEHAKHLIEKYGVDVLTYHQDVDTVGKVAEQYGVDFIAYNAASQGYKKILGNYKSLTENLRPFEVIVLELSI